MNLFFYFLKFISNFLSRVNNQLVKNQEPIEFKLYRERYPFERCCVLFTTFKICDFNLIFAEFCAYTLHEFVIDVVAY